MEIKYNYFKQFENSTLYLYSPNKKPLCVIHGVDKKCTLRLNSLSDLSMIVYETIQDLNGNNIKQECYDLIESKRLVFVERIGWFEIKDVSEDINNEGKYKSVSLQSEQGNLSNMGIYTEERTYAFYNNQDEKDDNYNGNIVSHYPSIIGQLNKQLGINLDIKDGDFEVTEDYINWTIVYIDEKLKNQFRTMENTTVTGYDFMTNNVSNAFEVIWEFDILHHSIKAKTIESVVTPTEIYLSKDNLINDLQISENSNDIVTVLTCKGSDLDISEVNPMGTDYIVNFDYYKNNNGKWMSQNLINVLNDWQSECDNNSESFKEKVSELRNLYLEESRLKTLIQTKNLLIDDLNNGRDLYISKTPVILEKIRNGEKSKNPNSEFCNTPFLINSEISYTCYKNSFILKGDNINNSYKNDSINKENTLKNNFDDEYIFFQDNDKTTYCKISKEENIFYIIRYGIYNNEVSDWCKEIEETSDVLVLAEIIDLDTKSLDSSSQFYNSFIKNNNTEIKCYNIQPKYSHENKRFYYNDEIEFIINTLDNCVNNNYIYFLDGDNKTYCKINMSAEIGEDNTPTYYASSISRYTIISNSSKWIQLHEEKNKKYENNLQEKQSKIENKLSKIKTITDTCNVVNYVKKESEDLYKELKCYWIEGDYENTNLAITENTPRDEYITLAEELMENGKQQLKRISQPKYSINISAINFMRLPQFIKFAKQLKLGRTIIIEKEDGILLEPALTEMSFNLDSSDDFSLTFSNSAKLNSDDFTFAELITQTNSITRNVQSNWSDLIAYSKKENEINSFILDPLNRSLKNGLNNMFNQEFIVDNTGIIGRKYLDDSKSSFNKEQMRIMNNTILFTDDNWENVKTALGKIYYQENNEDKTAYGLVAETIIGSLIMSEILKIQNKESTMNLDKDGIIIKKKVANENGEKTEIIVFKADVNGDVNITGEINATSGYIGDSISGFKIDNNSLSNNLDDLNKRVLLSTGSINNYTVGDNTQNNWMILAGKNFGVTNTGDMYASSGEIANLKIVPKEHLEQTTEFKIEGSIDEKFINVDLEKFYSKFNKYNIQTRFDFDGTYFYINDIESKDIMQIPFYGEPKIGDIINVTATTKGGKLIKKIVSTSSDKITLTGGELSEEIDSNGNTIQVCTHSNGTGGTVTQTVAIIGKETTISYLYYYYGKDDYFGIKKPILLSDYGITINGFIENNPYKTTGSNSGTTILSLSEIESYTPQNGDYIIISSSIKDYYYKNNGLYGNDFKLITSSYINEKNENQNVTGLYFWNNNQEDKEEYVAILDKTGITINNGYFKNGDIKEIKSNNIEVSNNILINNDVSINNKLKIKEIEMSYDNINTQTEKVVADISHTGDYLYLKLYNSKNELMMSKEDKTFSITYTTNFLFFELKHDLNITIYKGECFKAIPLTGTSPIKDVNFVDRNGNIIGKTLTYTQTITNENKILKINSSIYPTENNKSDLGSEDYKWCNIYSTNIYGENITQSDKNVKNSILDLSDEYSKLFDLLRPVTFKYNDGTSGRVHTGFIANELKENLEKIGLTTNDFAAYCEWENGENITCGIRYSEFIALCVKEIQKLKSKVKELEDKLNN